MKYNPDYYKRDYILYLYLRNLISPIMKVFQFLSVLPLMLWSHLCVAQMMANPAYFNPAFAGIQENPRAAFQYQSQWPVQDWNSRNMISSIDMGLPSIHSGVGIAAQHEETVDGKIKRDYANLMYNYEIKLSQNRFS